MRYIDSVCARAFPVDPAARLHYLRVVIVAAYACGILFSPRLWFSVGRSFPRAPVVTGLPAFLVSADSLASILLFASLGLSVLSKHPRRYLATVVVLTVLLAFLDQTRFQPWVFQYVVMLSVLASWQPQSRDTVDTLTTLSAIQLVLISLYFWSGAQKLNWSFGHEVIPALLESAGVHLPARFASYLPAVGVVIAGCEMLIGIGLLVPRTRRAAVLLAIGMHALLLLMLVVAWRNTVVLPWNVGMMTMVVLLFWRAENLPANRALREWRGPLSINHAPTVVFVLCSVAPALSFVGWWDLYLSAALYSGTAPVGVVHVSEQVRGRLSAGAQSHVFTTSRGELMLPLYEWSISELNVPPYPEERVYRKLGRQICSFAEDLQEVELIVKERPSLIDGSYAVRRMDCSDLFAR